MLSPDRLVIAPAIADALRAGRPVVALESTLISHGLPYPQNVEVAMASEQAVRDGGAEPATVAVHDGRLLVGLVPEQLDMLASSPTGVRKVSRSNLGAAIATGGWGATTVAATMITAHAAGIGVFSTGGIGGVHRGALSSVAGGPAPSLDISADLEELAHTPVAVVCAGPKAILDVPLTLEYLETRGVPVIGRGDRPGTGLLLAAERDPGAASACPTSPRPRRLCARTRSSGSAPGSSSARPCPRRMRSPTT